MIFVQGTKITIPRLHCTMSPNPFSKEWPTDAEKKLMGSPEGKSTQDSQERGSEQDSEERPSQQDSQEHPSTETKSESPNEDSDDQEKTFDFEDAGCQPGKRGAKFPHEDGDHQQGGLGSPDPTASRELQGSLELLDSRSTKEWLESCHSSPVDVESRRTLSLSLNSDSEDEPEVCGNELHCLSFSNLCQSFSFHFKLLALPFTFFLYHRLKDGRFRLLRPLLRKKIFHPMSRCDFVSAYLFV